MLGSKGEAWETVNLSFDQKPDREDEAKRIIEAGGRIDDNCGQVKRVWFQHEDKPGIAMTRSVGDKASKKIGVTHLPEFVTRKICVRDRFVIIASDGVWDYISSEEAVDIVRKQWETRKSEACCEALLKEAIRRWNEYSDVVDDISIIVVFLKAKA